MKSLKSLIPCVLLAFALTATAQTNSAPATNSTSGPVTKVGTDFLAWFKDNKPFFTNQVVQVEAGGLYNKNVKHHFGGFLDVQLPINDQMSLGFAGAYLNDELYDGALSFKLGKTLNILGKDIYMAVESGPGYNLSKSQVIAQSFATATTKWELSSKWTFTIGGGVGNISDLAGPVYAGALSLAYHGKLW